MGDGGGVDGLEDEAAAADAELDGGDGVLEVAVAGTPLDVEADDEALETEAVDELDLGDPVVDHGRSRGDKGVNLLAEERHVVQVAGVHNADRHRRWWSPDF